MSTLKAAKQQETKDTPKFSPRTTVLLKVGWPSIYPQNREAPFVFHMRIQLVKDAEEAQKTFLMLPDAEQTEERTHQYDAEMIAALSIAPPEGFPDFPKLVDHEGELAAAIREYFLPSDPERRAGMAFVCRGVMIKYWSAVLPADYL